GFARPAPHTPRGPADRPAPGRRAGPPRLRTGTAAGSDGTSLVASPQPPAYALHEEESPRVGIPYPGQYGLCLQVCLTGRQHATESTCAPSRTPWPRAPGTLAVCAGVLRARHGHGGHT